VGLSFMLIWAPHLWPQTAREWYADYEVQFWQQGFWLAGFREYPRDIDLGWLSLQDVDAGPVVGGYGIAASAFGIGAARVMGRADQAYQLTAEGLVASWPLPDGTLLVPRILSNISDAPYLGEAAALFALTCRSLEPLREGSSTHLPAAVYVGIAVLLAFGAYEIIASLRKLTSQRRNDPRWHTPAPQIQLTIWAILLAGAVLAWFALGMAVALVFLLAAVILPWRRRTGAGSPAYIIRRGIRRVSHDDASGEE